MPWPQAIDYTTVIQDPKTCLSDPELAGSVPEMNLMLGLPLSYCGNFAIVFKMTTPAGESWAVKCFIREVTDHQQRYAQIDKHLKVARRRFAVEFGYQAEGIKVGDAWFPVVKMRWVEGHTLNEFLRDHVHQQGLLDQLGQLWLRLAGEMRDSKMAHGDLQHGNVLLVPGKNAGAMVLRLVDYDGMWVPDLDGRPPGERGHANYQHPQRLREGGYSSEIDRFSNLLIYTSLRCLSVGGKSLWDKHDNGENLLFKETDFTRSAQSKLLPDLLDLGDTDTVALVGHLLTSSRKPLEQVPLLADLMSVGPVQPLTGEQRDVLGEMVPGSKAFRKVMPTPPPTVKAKPASLPELPGALIPPVPSVPPPPIPSVPVPEVVELLTPIPVPPPPPPPAKEAYGLLADPDLPPIPTLSPPPVPSAKETAGPAIFPPPIHAPGVPLPLPPAPSKRPSKLKLDEVEPIDEGKSNFALWAGIGGGVAALLLLVAGGVTWWMMGSGPKPKQGPTTKLLAAKPVEVRAGDAAEVVITGTWDRTGGAPQLTFGNNNPDGVTCEVISGGPMPADPTLLAYKVKIQTARRTPVAQANLTAVLEQDGLPVHEQAVTLSVTTAVPPKLGNIEAHTIRAGERAEVAVLVRLDPPMPEFTARLAGLPAGVRVFGSKMDGSELKVTLESDRKAVEGPYNVALDLLENGTTVARGNFALNVLPPPPAEKPSLKLEVPSIITLKTGEGGRATVKLTRTNLKGRITLRVTNRPFNVNVDPVTADETDATVELVFTVGASATLTDGHVAILTASVGGDEVKRVDLNLVIERGVPGLVTPRPPRRGETPEPRAVKITTGDELQLNGTLYGSDAPKENPTVMILHDLQPSRAASPSHHVAITKLAKALQKEGCTVLTFDFRGFGTNYLAGTAVPPRFYRSCSANITLQSQLRAALRLNVLTTPPLDSISMPRLYHPFLVQDVIAARHFLDLEHDRGRANTKNLYVIGVGEGGQLALLWTLAETNRSIGRGDRQAAIEDVKGVAMVGLPPATVPWPTKSVFLTRAQMQVTVPVMVLSDGVTGAGPSVATFLRRGGKDRPVVHTVKGTGQRTGYLAQDPVQDALVKPVAAMKRSLTTWSSRDVTRQSSFWNIGYEVSAYNSGDDAPQLLNLSQWGFTTRVP